jgi:hypothetical protein
MKTKMKSFLIVALSAALLTNPIPLYAKAPSLKAAKKALGQAVQEEDAKKIHGYFSALAKVNSPAAAKLIIRVTSTALHLDLANSASHELASMDALKVRSYLYKESRQCKKWWVRLLLVEVLSKIGKAADKPLYEAVKDEHPVVLSKLITIFERRRSKRSLEAILTILANAEKTNKQELSSAACAALARMTGKTLEAAVDWQNWWSAARESFDFSKAKEAQKAGKKKVSTVTERIKKRGDGSFLERLGDGDIVVVEGKFDEVQGVLKQLKLPHVLVTRKGFETFKLNKKQVLIINCDGDKLSDECVKKIKGFVAAGGYLFTSDWELHAVLTKAFPKVISQKTVIDEDLVDISPVAKHRGHPYLRDVFPKDPYKLVKFRWKIDGASDLQAFTPKSGVVPLVFSRQMNKKHGHGVVALTFRWRGGVIIEKRRRPRPTTGGGTGYSQKAVERLGGSVLHVLGHFNAQKDPKGDGYALQQLLLNFIIEKQKFRAAGRSGKKK